MAQWAELEAFTRTIDLDPRVLNGSVTEEVDLQKLYYIYVSSKPDDWNFILQTRGLGRHVKDFAAIEPSWGQHSPAIELPDFDIDQIDHLFDIHRSPDQATQRALHLSKLVVPEVVRLDDRVVCRTNQRSIDLNAMDVVNFDKSSLEVLITTNSPVKLTVEVSVYLERNLTDWTQGEGRR